VRLEERSSEFSIGAGGALVDCVIGGTDKLATAMGKPRRSAATDDCLDVFSVVDRPLGFAATGLNIGPPFSVMERL
jgi:hypothetical protein